MKSGNEICLVYVILRNEKFLSKTSMKYDVETSLKMNLRWSTCWFWEILKFDYYKNEESFWSEI